MKKPLLSLITLLTIISALGLDLWTKRVFFIFPLENPQFIFLNGYFRQIDHRNYGIMGNLPIPQPMILIITLIALFYFGIELKKYILQHQIKTLVFLSIVIAGALGNLYDRSTLGYVRDWILLFNRSAINLADIMIGCGLLGWIWHKIKPQIPQ